jgi:uncharacterized repeat protein (TIGR01451 family)
MSSFILKSRRRNLVRSIAMAVLLCAPIATDLHAIAQITPLAPTPLPKDWCGRIWGIVASNGSIIWDDPTTGASKTTSPAPGIVAPVPGITGAANSDYASLGIHARSGTLYSLNRNSATRPIFQYSMSNPTAGWTSPTASGVPTATSSTISNTNFNKMTVIGDKLLIANSDSTLIYTYDITPATGALSTTPTVEVMSFNNDTPGASTVAPYTGNGNPLGTTGISGGDIAQDEYGKIYMLTYDNSAFATLGATQVVPVTTPENVYFYEKSGTTWIYKDKAVKVPIAGDYSEQFGGFAIYADTFYVKGAGISGTTNLYKLPLTRTLANDYNWSTNASSLATVGSGTGSADLATCGVPALTVVKTEKVVTDAVGSAVVTRTPDRIVTGDYIKYQIVATNVGDAWARDTYINDVLPTGVVYVPNSATLNGLNLNAPTYPFSPPIPPATLSTPINAVGSSPGVITLGLGANTTNQATITYIVQVDGSKLDPTTGKVKNQAEVGYLNPYKSDPANCDTGLNCGVNSSPGLYPSIFGNVWNDINGSAAGTFSTIKTGTETGTNAGTTVGATNALYAILLNSAGKEIASSPVAADGSYKFLGLNPSQTGLNIQLSTTAGIVNTTTPVNPPAVGIPTGWKATSPKATSSTAIAPNPITSFDLALVDILDKDFGITLPAGIILVKRITAINGLTTNDGKNLTAVVDPTTTTTTNDDAIHKWPADYLKGAVDAGKVKPGDTIEYTIYYLNDGSADAKKLKICDPIHGNHTYDPNSMKMLPGGLADLPVNYTTLTDGIALGVDRANSYAAGAANIPGNCNAVGSTIAGTDNGGVSIEITGSGSSVQPNLLTIPGATAAGSPTSSYGWFRFRTKVNP